MAAGTRDLTEGPVWVALAALSGPMISGILAGVSPEALAAVGFVYPVTMTISSLFIGLSAGASAVISQAPDRRDAAGTVTRRGLHALGLGVIFASLAALLFRLLHAPLLNALGAEGAMREAAQRYTPVGACRFRPSSR